MMTAFLRGIRALSRNSLTLYRLQSSGTAVSIATRPGNKRPTLKKGPKKSLSFEEEKAFWDAQLLGREEKTTKKFSWSRTKSRYTMNMLNSVRKNNIKEAEHIFKTMFEKKIRPEVTAFNVMIQGYANVGDAKHAFKVFNDLKKRSLLPTDYTYTSMFTACARAGPRALQILEKVQAEIERRKVSLNILSFNAQLSAMVRCGVEPENIVELFEEAKKNSKLHPNIETFSTLLVAASEDPERGLKMALMIWELLISALKPDLYCYNSFLTCLRDAGVPDDMAVPSDYSTKVYGICNEHMYLPLTGTRKVIIDVPIVSKELHPSTELTISEESSLSQESKSPNKELLRKSDLLKQSTLSLESDSPPKSASLQKTVLSQQKSACISKEVDSLSLTIHFANNMRMLDTDSVEKLLTTMEAINVPPNIRTYTLLASFFPDVKYLVGKMSRKKRKVARDESFFMAAINLRRRLQDISGAKDVYGFMKSCKVQVTGEEHFRCLAYICTTQDEAKELIEDMEKANVAPSVGVYNTFIRTFMQRKDYTFLLHLLRKMYCEKVEIPEQLQELFKKFLQSPPKRKIDFIEYSALKGYYKMVDSKLKTDESDKTVK